MCSYQGSWSPQIDLTSIGKGAGALGHFGLCPPVSLPTAISSHSHWLPQGSPGNKHGLFSYKAKLLPTEARLLLLMAPSQMGAAS